MINGNGKPVSNRKQVQFMIALTLLAWATQTLRHQWARGSEAATASPRSETSFSDSAISDSPRPVHIPAAKDADADDIVASTSSAALTPPPAAPREKFVSTNGATALPGTLELRSDATIVGSDVQLKQICRWTDGDQPTFAPLADFVVEHFKTGGKSLSVSMDEIRKTLQDAGVNVAVIDFIGVSSCKVTRSDAESDAIVELAPAQPAQLASSTMTNPIAAANSSLWHGAADQGIAVSSPTTAPSATADSRQYQTLRDKLIADCAERIHVPVDQLQLEFRPQDAHVLALSEPQFRFDLRPERVRNLGDVAWYVTILTDTGSQKVSIEAEARAWQNQLVVMHPLANNQVIRDEDCVERRTMVDSLSEDPVLTRAQLVGQQASREISPGTVMSARLVQAVPMVRSGQLVTITLTQGTVQIKSVARAMENGAFGENIRVMNEETRDIYQATMTGPQTADIDPNPVSSAVSGLASSLSK